MLKFDLLILGDTGWGDELLISSIMTILVSLSAMGLGIFIAIFTSWAKISGNIILKIIANFYTTVIRGVPELLVIYLIFFGSSAGIMYISKIFGYHGYIELNALPGLGNVWQITLKDTALISVTGLVEIMRQSRIAANVTHSPLTFYLSAAVLYLILTTFSSKAFNKLEDYSNKNQVKA